MATAFLNHNHNQTRNSQPKPSPTAAFIINRVLDQPEYSRLIRTMKSASNGTVHIIGGFLFRHIDAALQEGPEPKVPDIDFCTDGAIDTSILKRTFGNFTKHHKFDGVSVDAGGLTIEIFELRKHVEIVHQQLPPTIVSYLNSVIYDIQSISFDLTSRTILEGGAINSILRREIGIKCAERFERDRANLIERGVVKARSMQYSFVVDNRYVLR